MVRGLFSIIYTILTFLLWLIKITLVITIKLAINIFLVMVGTLILLISKKR